MGPPIGPSLAPFVFRGKSRVFPENRLLDALLHEALAPIEAQELEAAE